MIENTKIVNSDLRTQIEIDHESKTICVGRWKSTRPELYLQSENDFCFKRNILAEIDREVSIGPTTRAWNTEDLKNAHAIVARYIGCKFNRRFCAANFKLWIDPYRELLHSCFYSNGYKHYYSTSQILRFWKNKQIAIEVYNDCLYHLLPLVIYFGASPKKLRGRLGRELWRRLSHKSSSTNKLIVKLLESKFGHDRIGPVRKYDNYIVALKYITKSKSTAIKLYKFDGSQQKQTFESLYWISRYSKVSNKQDHEYTRNLYEDTRNMCARLAKRFNPDWSRLRMRKEHDVCSREITAQEYSTERFDWMHHESDSFKILGSNVTVLDSPASMAHEGYVMGHCLAFYIDYVYRREYIACAIESAEEHTTIGFNITRECLINIDQHFGISNMVVSSQINKSVALKLRLVLQNYLGSCNLRSPRARIKANSFPIASLP